MDTTTSDGGAGTPAEPTQASEAVAAEDKGAQVITNDENGTPTLEDASSQAQSASEQAVSEQPQTEESKETQAEDFDVEAYAKKKGIDLDKADPKTLVKMQYEAEKRMHEATAKARELETTAVAQVPLDYTGDPNIDALNQQVNTLLIKNNVNDYFSRNPEAREFESKMAEIVTQRPHLQNDLDALYALARTDPNRDTELKAQGGKEALTNLAQKQQQIPPGANATNSAVYESATITPGNVYELIDNNDQAWFQKNYKTINKAISGK